MVGGEGRSFVLLVVPLHCLVGLDCSALPAGAADCVEDESFVVRSERDGDDIGFSQVQRKCALLGRIVIDQQVKCNPCGCEGTHQFVRAVGYLLFET